MKIYTATGDEGKTGLFAGPRVSKDHARIEAYGTVDELNASLGFARSMGQTEQVDKLLHRIQNELFAVGAELATIEPEKHGTHWIGKPHIAYLEQTIDSMEEQLEPLSQFILPAGKQDVTSLHLARAVCRRAERRVVSLGSHSEHPLSADLIVYLNRLGDLLFVVSRFAAMSTGQTDIAWQKPE
jgi:cob(I)alamin adenosyltransferase